MMIQFTRPSKIKTQRVLFEQSFLPRDSGTLEQLKELSSKRRLIEESINEKSCVTEAIAREMSGGLTSRCEQNIQKLEQYLLLLENLLFHVTLVAHNPQIAHSTADLKLRWSSALSSSSLFNRISSKLYQIDNIRFELGMAFYLYGALLRDRAIELLSTDLVQSASLLRKAAGVFDYLAHEVLPPLQPKLPPEKPPEATVCMSSMMSLICLAEAQAVTARKAEEKGNTGSLLAKLHYGVSQFLDEAISILHLETKVSRDISSCFMDFISSCKTLHELKTHKFIAEGLKADGQIGIAIGVLRRALAHKWHSPREDSWRPVYKQMVVDLTGVLKKYEHENEFVWHEKVPADDLLPLPESVTIVSAIRYKPQRRETTLNFRLQ